MKLSAPFVETLNRDSSVIIILDPTLAISHLNLAWNRNAARYGAPLSCAAVEVIGRSYLDFVAGDMKLHMKQAFNQVLQAGPGPHSVWLHSECNTPKLFRKLTTRITSLWGFREATPAGYLVHSDLRAVCSLGRRYELIERTPASLRDPLGMITQCGCCRRVRDPNTREWAMSVELLRRSASGTSHGLCEVCLETYYSDRLSPSVGAGSEQTVAA